MTDEQAWLVRAIGTVSSSRDDAIDDDWGDVEATITLVPPYDARSVRGLEEFSHLEVVFLFDRVDEDAVCTGSRHPRGNPDWPEVGIFAQRAKDRPNRIGLSTCELVRVDGTRLHVRGLDAIEGTPVLDVKPYMEEFAARGPVRQPTWSRELMAGYY
ncbi:MAG TPA: tRNA (N6-threonylcarbamoyladenosine(37)-N6)-methyltransferase TrmO [Acidimicrobiia bacterium]|jgi:tRNA-Thr(GGU) m(6)t(6)A37 methyltransferase TsaA